MTFLDASRLEIKCGFISDDEKQQIADLSEQLSSTEIALKLNRYPATIDAYMIREGLKAPLYSATSAFTRATGRVMIPFSRKEDIFITDLRIQGLSAAKIAKQSSKKFGIDRREGSVYFRLRRLAGFQETSEPLDNIELETAAQIRHAVLGIRGIKRERALAQHQPGAAKELVRAVAALIKRSGVMK